MAALGFKKRFAPKVRSGKKRQTIRAVRKYPIVPGETLYLYTAMRTKYCEKLREVVCKSVNEIEISFNLKYILIHNQDRSNVPVTYLHIDELNVFAKADGFTDWEDMKAFWLAEHGVKKGKRKVILRKFKGILITW